MRAVIPGLLFLCALTAATTAQAAPDPWITAKVKMKLWSTKGIPSGRIMVDTNEGVVTLYGKVPTADDGELAQEVASNVSGVTAVNDLLQVVPKSEESAVTASDNDLKQQVENALRDDSALAKSKITVKSVDAGIVLLTGSADGFVSNFDAQADASAIAGVKQVINEIQAPEGFAVQEWSFFGPKDTSPTVMTDGAVTVAVKEKLASDAKVSSRNIFVDTHHGKVCLFGEVANDAQRKAAAKDARSIHGVKTVDNELQLKPTPDQEAAMKDQAVANSVKKLLANDDELAKVNVKVIHGAVKLSGRVPSSWERAHASLLSRDGKGVRSVYSEVQIDKD